MAQEPLFAPETAAVAGEFAVAGKNAVARDDDGDGVLAVGGAHGSDSLGVANGVGDVLVGEEATVRDGEEFLPDALLEGRAGRFQGEVESLALALEIFG